MPQPDLFRTPQKPWNAGRLVGPKAPLKPKHIWAIRQQLKSLARVRDLAMFNCALDAKLRACDLVKLRVSDVAPGGVLRERSTVIQQKTGRPVPFEITDPTREALAAWLQRRGRRADDWLFPSRSRPGGHIGTRQYEARRPLGRYDRTGASCLRDAQSAAYEGGARLQEDRQPPCLPAAPGPSKAGEHCPLSRDRSRRCARALGATGDLTRLEGAAPSRPCRRQ